VTAARPTLDVSGLPAEVRDARSPAWWGNALFMAIETATVALLLASYFYAWRNYPSAQWPPPRVDRDPPLADPVPELLYGTLNTVLLLGSCFLMAWVDRACQRQFDDLERLNVSKPSEAPEGERPPSRPAGVLLGLAGLVAIGVLSTVLRFYEFPGLLVSWDDNAYGSLVWTILGLHLVYIVIEAIEMAVLAAWIALYELGENQAGDVILSAIYWYWTVAVWVVMYGVVYWFPRVA
jgi:cytochrome c oxidase subunit III